MNEVRRRFPEVREPVLLTDEKEAKKQNGCFVKFLYLLLTAVGLTCVVAVVGFLRSPFTALKIENPSQEVVLYGSLRANSRLTEGMRIYGLNGPESIVEDQHRNLYTGLADGRIVKIEPSTDGEIGTGTVTNVTTGVLPKAQKIIETAEHGRPFGLLIRDNTLYVADAVYGVYTVDIKTHAVKNFIPFNTVNPPYRFPNDLCLSKDGKYLYFTDSSSKHSFHSTAYIAFEGSADGRVIQYNLQTKKSKVVTTNLSFANGVQLSESEGLLFVAETFRYRIRIVDTTTWFTKRIVSLPIMPDNITPTGKGTYWVSGFSLRTSKFEFLEKYPIFRQIAAGLFSHNTLLRELVNPYNILIEMREDGRIIQSLHDPEGQLITGHSAAVTLSNRRVALGSVFANYFSILKEKDIAIGGAY